MIITPLGHTEFLVDVLNKTGENIRILVDTWLSDYVIGDLMERSPHFKIDKNKLESIDVIYISHSHTDHIDPYTIIKIYEHASPILILSNTLKYLEPLFRDYIPNIQIEFLIPKKTYHLKGIEITGYMFSKEGITNEDDVMMIAISSETELIFAEIDTVPDEYDEEVQSEIFQIFDRREYQTRMYLASRNELEGQLRIYDYDEHRRKSYRPEYIAGRKEDMRSSYEKFEYDEYSDLPNIMTLPGFVRGFIGQGLRYPVILSSSLSGISIFPLEEIASMEADIAHTFGYEFAQKALLPGRQYRIENGTIEPGRKECPIGEILKNPMLNDSVNKNDIRILAQGPLIHRELTSDDINIAVVRILEILNSRFLPYWSASPVASLRSALIKNSDGAYRISFRLSSCKDPFENKEGERGNQNLIREGKSDPAFRSTFVRRTGSSAMLLNNKDAHIVIFEYSLASSEFSEVPNTPKLRVDEDYWLLDILDFLGGKQELYSNFWHTLDPKRIYRLWTCLGANFCNNDLVIAKYRYHFERAKKSQSANNFVESIILGLGK